MDKSKHIYVTIKGTLRCNLACQYCYGRDNHSVGKQMTDEELYDALLFIHDYVSEVEAKSVTLCWHGGEPLLMSSVLPSVIEMANRLFKELGVNVFHGLQTNAVALTPNNFGFIKKYLNGGIGVSLDLYSRYRTFPNGEVSNDLVIRNIDKALEYGIDFGSINLLTHDNIDRIRDIYEFYKIRKMNVRLARVFPIRADDIYDDPMYLSDEEFAQAMIEYFDLWANDETMTYNRDIMSLIGDILLGKPSLCYREKECHKRYLALSPGGDIFTCAEFDVQETVVGNFLTQNAHEFILSDKRDKLARKAPVPELCASCKYYKICYGGCFRERFMLGYPYRCKSNSVYWDHVLEWLQSKGATLYMLEGKTADESRAILRKIFAH